MQSLTGQKIELCPDRAGDGGRDTRAQRFFHGPERLLIVAGFDHDDAGGIEAETVQAMTVQASVRGGRDEHHGTARRETAEQGGHETEGGRPIRLGRRQDFVDGVQDKTGLRQAGIDGRHSQSENAVLRQDGVCPRQQTAQFIHDLGARAAVGQGNGHDFSVFGCEMDIRTKREQCKGGDSPACRSFRSRG